MMRIATTATALPTLAKSAESAERSVGTRLLGVAIASLVPAIFWSVVIQLVAGWLGARLSATAITVTGASIALFLFAVCAPLMLRASAPVSSRRGNVSPSD